MLLLPFAIILQASPAKSQTRMEPARSENAFTDIFELWVHFTAHRARIKILAKKLVSAFPELLRVGNLETLLTLLEYHDEEKTNLSKRFRDSNDPGQERLILEDLLRYSGIDIRSLPPIPMTEGGISRTEGLQLITRLNRADELRMNAVWAKLQKRATKNGQPLPPWLSEEARAEYRRIEKLVDVIDRRMDPETSKRELPVRLPISEFLADPLDLKIFAFMERMIAPDMRRYDVLIEAEELRFDQVYKPLVGQRCWGLMQPSP